MDDAESGAGRRVAVVLFNLGGPDGPGAVKPFLFNLFSDPAIIQAPQPLRWLLAKFISWRRAPVAGEIYSRIGGRSPLLELTIEQARGLETRLAGDGAAKVFVAMRYWRPRARDVARSVKEFAPGQVVLLPLYPQFSTTTTESALTDWMRAAGDITAPVRAVCCYPDNPGFVRAQAKLIARAREAAGGAARVLFSAHGLPEKIVHGGDPYRWQVERTAAEVVGALGDDGLDWAVCYQSRVGPLKWIGPSLDEELARAAEDRVAVIVAPVAFVSEHSETLVELDMEYREMAGRLGVPGYHRVPAVGTEEDFMDGLAGLVRTALEDGAGHCGRQGGRLCPGGLERCMFGRNLAGN